jgi:DNA-binding Xre family transcriptional regulator
MNSRVIKLRVKEVLAEQGRSLYWLAKESGVPYKTLLKWRDDALDSFDRSVLDRVATALKCQPGDLLTHTPDN